LQIIPSLWLEDIEFKIISDTEPFIENGLDVYFNEIGIYDGLLRMRKVGYCGRSKNKRYKCNEKRGLMLSGKFLDYPNIEDLIDENSEHSQKQLLNCLPTFRREVLQSANDYIKFVDDFYLIYQT